MLKSQHQNKSGTAEPKKIPRSESMFRMKYTGILKNLSRILIFLLCRGEKKQFLQFT